jgi:uncharacterized protein (DUF1501 family)
MRITRRKFFAHSSSLLLSLTPFLDISAKQIKTNNFFDSYLPDDKRVVVFIHLAGGNDWLNTIIPYSQQSYYESRPNIGIVADECIRLDNCVGFHPSLSELKALYDQNQVAILLDCGLKEHNLSHHIANKQLQTLSEENNIAWQSRYAELVNIEQKNEVLPAISVQPNFGGVQIEVNSFLERSNNFEFNLDIHYKINNNHLAESKKYGFVQAMSEMARLINSRMNARIYHISLGGFDTHENQLEIHDFLLGQLSKGLSIFQRELDKANMSKQVVTVVYSEFGRSLKENNDHGTDHDYINDVLIVGKSLKGGIYGKRELANSENNHSINYGSVLSTLLENWLKCPSEKILGQKFDLLPFV